MATTPIAPTTDAGITLPPVGSPAPPFGLPSTEDREITLADYRGRAVVLYFYPKDDTPGCTLEATSFRDLQEKFGEHEAQVLGVSTDGPRSHKKFRDKYNLPFPLLSDTDHRVCELYGVWQKKRFMGREYLGVARSTFVIDPQGRIATQFPNVKVRGHGEQVLAAVLRLSQRSSDGI